MTVSLDARRHRNFRLCGIYRAASARSEKFKFTQWADFVEKVIGFDVARLVTALILLNDRC